MKYSDIKPYEFFSCGVGGFLAQKLSENKYVVLRSCARQNAVGAPWANVHLVANYREHFEGDEDCDLFWPEEMICGFEKWHKEKKGGPAWTAEDEEVWKQTLEEDRARSLK